MIVEHANNDTPAATPTASASPWRDVKSAAEVALVGTRTIYNACKSGQLRHAIIGARSIRIHETWITDWLERCAAPVAVVPVRPRVSVAAVARAPWSSSRQVLGIELLCEAAR